MTNEKDADGNLLPDDQRLKPYGKHLRASSLDELGELLNIIKGDMAVVGPRPQLVRDMVFMTPEQRKRHIVRQGFQVYALLIPNSETCRAQQISCCCSFYQAPLFL